MLAPGDKHSNMDALMDDVNHLRLSNMSISDQTQPWSMKAPTNTIIYNLNAINNTSGYAGV